MKRLLLKVWQYGVPESLKYSITRIVNSRFNAGLAGVFFDQDGNVLLFRHTYRSVPWGVPTGWLEYGEQPEEGMLREVIEESGLKVHIAGVHRVFADRTRLDIILAGSFLGGQFEQSAEISQYGLFPLNGLPEGLHPPQRRIIADVWDHWQGRLSWSNVE